MLSRDQIIGALATAVAPFHQSVALYTLGSFASIPCQCEEFDFVLLVDDPLADQTADLAEALHAASCRLPVENVLHVCNSFIPRSYDVPLTLHCAVYSRDDLTTRRPRLIQDLVQQHPAAGECEWAAELAAVRWAAADLLVERWGVDHVLQILKERSWSVPLWRLGNGSAAIEPRLLRLDDPRIHLEFLWYSASKLTQNLRCHVSRSEDEDLLAGCLALLKPLQHIVADVRNGGPPEPFQNRAAAAWQQWFVEFSLRLMQMLGSAKAGS